MKIDTLNGKKRGAQQPGVREAQLLAYCAMASGALIAAQPADAAIVYSGVQNLSVAGGNTVNVDLDGNTVNDFQFKNASISSTVFYNAVKPLLSNALGQTQFFDLPQSLAVNASLTWRTQGFFTHPNGLVLNFASSAATNGFFYNGTGNGTGFLGVRFKIDTTTHYGWIRYDGAASVTGPSATGLIVEWAYESTPDASILVGELSVTTTTTTIPPTTTTTTIPPTTTTTTIPPTTTTTTPPTTTTTTIPPTTTTTTIPPTTTTTTPPTTTTTTIPPITTTTTIPPTTTTTIPPTTTTTTIPPTTTIAPTTTTTTIITPCSLTVRPAQISKLASFMAPIRRIVIRSQTDAALPANPDINWGTDAIKTLWARTSNNNTIVAWVIIRPMRLTTAETYNVTVGDCTGKLITR